MREDILLEEFGERLREVLQRKLEEKNSSPCQERAVCPIFRYEVLRERIVYRLVNYGRNKEDLREVPHIRLLDLALTFHVLVKAADDEVGTFQIRNSHMEYWGVTCEDLREQAAKNTPKLFPAWVRTMEEVLERCGLSFPDTDEPFPMYVITNKPGINGASVILYPSVLSDLAGQLHSDLYLLPSSIHEFIAIPSTTEHDSASLREIVAQVNETEVSEEDYLSGEVYRYDRKNSRIFRSDLN